MAGLGGTGLMGRIAVKDLAASAGVDRVTITDRDTKLARTVHEELVATLRGADAAINSVHYDFNLGVMRACL